MYEVFLMQKVVKSDGWREFLRCLARYLGQGEQAELRFNFDGAMLRIFLKTGRELPHFLVGAEQFVLGRAENEEEERVVCASCKIYLAKQNENMVMIAERLRAQGQELLAVHLMIRKVARTYRLKTYLVVNEGGANKMVRLRAAGSLLDLDLRKKYLLKKAPKYLNLAKSLQLLSTDVTGAILRLDAYPYLKGEHYLSLKDFDFYKHTVVFGASGAGKTKFLAKMIEQVAKKYGDKYHVMVVDPHDALKDEIGGLSGVKVYDFSTKERGLDLFFASEQEIVNSVDTTLGLLKSLMMEDWNARLARLLRAALYLLILKGELNLQNLRRVLTDIAYKNVLVAELGEYLPESLQEFFGQDYNELKTQHYDATFARALTFIDELQLAPAFYRKNEKKLDYELMENRVTVVSLNAAKLGEKAVKTLAGLVMNQLFILGVQRRLGQHIILVVDEVAVVENPILERFLAEARKYDISVVLAGQYFAQVSEELREAIFANVANYWCFRVNYADAELLAKYLDMELSDNRQLDLTGVERETFGTGETEKLRMLATLPVRNVVVRVSRNGMVLPAVIGRSLDFQGMPELEKGALVKESVTKRAPRKTLQKQVSGEHLKMTQSNLFEIMREQSTSRRKIS